MKNQNKALEVAFLIFEAKIGLSTKLQFRSNYKCQPWVFSASQSYLLNCGVSGFSGFFTIEHVPKSGNHRKLQFVIFQRSEDFSCYYKTFLIFLSFQERGVKVLLQVISANRELILRQLFSFATLNSICVPSWLLLYSFLVTRSCSYG